MTRRLRAQTAYQPVFEDWLFHLLLPLAAYAMLAGSACVPHSYVHPAMSAALALLFIGVHNAWDAVTYHVFVRSRQEV